MALRCLSGGVRADDGSRCPAVNRPALVTGRTLIGSRWADMNLIERSGGDDRNRSCCEVALTHIHRTRQAKLSLAGKLSMRPRRVYENVSAAGSPFRGSSRHPHGTA